MQSLIFGKWQATWKKSVRGGIKYAPRRNIFSRFKQSSWLGTSRYSPRFDSTDEQGNQHSPTTIICPLTSQDKTPIETHVTLTPSDAGILKVSTVLCEQVRVVDKTRLKKKLGEVVNRNKIEDINRKLMISIGIGV